ncbi:MAG TPA: ParB/RepB/Spo0J family partition protein [Nitriliruptorales bacterium]|nr:ParB/RepB/Spo0J family partition protein [Nitriliruptorales bacterium]
MSTSDTNPLDARSGGRPDLRDRRGLGRGLSALIPTAEGTGNRYRELPISAVSPNPRQPRGGFDEADLAELAASIREVGLLQPVVVRETATGRFELIAGERRLRAAKLAGMTRIPALVRATSDTDLLKEAVIENVHRVQLNPLEEAAAFQQLLEDLQATQEELAARLGKSRPAISNALRLLTLPASVQRRVAAGLLTAGHAKAILALERREQQERLAERIVAEGLSVRDAEEAARVQRLDGGSAPKGPPPRDRGRLTSPGLVGLEERLSDALMARVKVTVGARRGRLTVEFASVDDLERIVGVIAGGLQTAIPVRDAPLRP